MGSWFKVDLVYDYNTLNIFVNGIAGTALTRGAISSYLLPLNIGTIPDASKGAPFFGHIDELRNFSQGARTLGWSITEYNNWFSPQSFFTVDGNPPAGFFSYSGTSMILPPRDIQLASVMPTASQAALPTSIGRTITPGAGGMNQTGGGGVVSPTTGQLWPLGL
jgi:hypothetical protein